MKRYFALAFCTLLIACQPVPQRPEYPMPRFDHLPRIPVNAAKLNVVQQYRSPMQSPYVEQLMPIAPAAAVEQWIRDRVELVGTNGEVTFTISDAHVAMQDLPRTKGIKGAFTKDQSELYQGRLVVTAHLEVNTPAASYADADSEVTVKKSLIEGSSLQDRDNLYYTIMKDMTARFAEAMEPQLRARFNPGGGR